MTGSLPVTRIASLAATASKRAPLYLHLAGVVVTDAGGGPITFGAVGSGVAVGLFDVERRIAGCALYLLPRPPDATVARKNPDWFGSLALPRLLHRLYQRGCRPEALRAVVLGGADLGPLTVGARNLACATAFLDEHRIPTTRSAEPPTRSTILCATRGELRTSDASGFDGLDGEVAP